MLGAQTSAGISPAPSPFAPSPLRLLETAKLMRQFSGAVVGCGLAGGGARGDDSDTDEDAGDAEAERSSKRHRAKRELTELQRQRDRATGTRVLRVGMDGMVDGGDAEYGADQEVEEEEPADGRGAEILRNGFPR